MEEYQEQNKSTVTSAVEHQNIVMDAWQLIVADYDREIGDCKETFGTNPTQHSVEKEYSTYIIGALSTGTMSDTLGFWKVGYLQNST